MLDCMKKLKGKLPLGMEIPQITELNETSKKAKAIRYASYEFRFDSPLTQEQADAFLELDTIEVIKKTKRSEGVANIRADIMDMYVTGEGVLCAVISAGSEANLKADLFVTALEKYIDGFSAGDYKVIRTGILDERGISMM